MSRRYVKLCIVEAEEGLDAVYRFRNADSDVFRPGGT